MIQSHQDKPRVAVFFGGESTEHDVSVLTGIQAVEAIDSSRFTPFPVYIDLQGQWWCGEALLNRKNYPITRALQTQLVNVHLPIGRTAGASRDRAAQLVESDVKGLFKKPKTFAFDIALPAFHGTKGEDGPFQGVMDMADIPYASQGVAAGCITMDKALAKAVFRSAGLCVLDDFEFMRPPRDVKPTVVDEMVTKNNIIYPVCAKPCHLGSSIGVHRCDTQEELIAALRQIFIIDTKALVEPFIENLVEYNVAVTSCLDDDLTCSTIEMPLREGKTLDFRDKYLSNDELDTKLSVPVTEGMASAMRDLYPELSDEARKFITETAMSAYRAARCEGGAVRFDFLCNSKTNDLWLNEANPIPGSFGYYLWEAATPRVGFTTLLSAMLDDAIARFSKQQRSVDPRSSGGGIFS